MEQLSFTEEIENNCESIENEIKNTLIREIDNPEYIKYLAVSPNKDGSISIKAKSYVATKINLKKKKAYIEFKSKYSDEFRGYHIDSSSEGYSRISISGFNDVFKLSKILSILFMKELCEIGGESFGCCHRYEACSDERKCLHPNVMTAQACTYKRNLDAGRIFYGKNKNI